MEAVRGSDKTRSNQTECKLNTFAVGVFVVRLDE